MQIASLMWEGEYVTGIPGSAVERTPYYSVDFGFETRPVIPSTVTEDFRGFSYSLQAST